MAGLNDTLRDGIVLVNELGRGLDGLNPPDFTGGGGLDLDALAGAIVDRLPATPTTGTGGSLATELRTGRRGQG